MKASSERLKQWKRGKYVIAGKDISMDRSRMCMSIRNSGRQGKYAIAVAGIGIEEYTKKQNMNYSGYSCLNAFVPDLLLGCSYWNFAT